MPADGPVFLVALPSASRNISAHNTLYRKHFHFLHIILFPSQSLLSKKFRLVFYICRKHMVWNNIFGKTNQNFDICVKMAPFFVILFFKIWSNAEILSVAVIMRLSPLSYTSRTFPSLIGLNSCMLYPPFMCLLRISFDTSILLQKKL